MKTRVLAVVAALSVSVAVGTSASKAEQTPIPPGDSSAVPSRDLPPEIREFLDRRFECNHAIAADRSRQLRCTELLTDEAALKWLYSGNDTVLRVLNRPLLQNL
jgi:hypothetical protein